MSHASAGSYPRRLPRRNRQRSRDEAELREFLEGDERSSELDPEFRERLRTELWELLEARRKRRRRGGP